MNAHDLSEDGTVTGINVTPMVDIMLVLLIIFMVTAKLASDSELKVNIPQAATAEAPASAALTVSIEASGAIKLMDRAVDVAGLKESLSRESKANPGVRVTLAADGKLPYTKIVEVLDSIRQAGVTRVGLAAERTGA